MSAALPSPSPPSRRGRQPVPVEALQEKLGLLLLEREHLRVGGSPEDLERNRLAIIGAQWDLAYALIAENAG
jgi:hypothetical protein